MSQETTMTFRLDARLRERFARAAENVQMPAAQILRILMQNFVDHVQEKSVAHDRETRERRAQAMKFAEASANFEGCYLPESARPVVARYINGEIDTETALKTLLA